jgi:hypothetical protein
VAAARDRLIDLTREVVVGDPTRSRVHLGAVINARQHAKHTAALARARQEGLVVAGGNTDDSVGWFVEPTLRTPWSSSGTPHDADVAALLAPSSGRLGEHRADQPDDGGAVGEDADDVGAASEARSGPTPKRRQSAHELCVRRTARRGVP